MLIEALNIFKLTRNVSITLFNVVEVTSTTLPINSSLFEREIANERSKMQPLASWLNSQNFDVNSKVSVSRSAAEGIVEEANSEGYYFIIMMKRKLRGRFQKFFHKSITEDVIKNTRCMVLTFLIDEKRALRL
jgi:nucleotide-binding universal stress UspA family protein